MGSCVAVLTDAGAIEYFSAGNFALCVERRNAPRSDEAAEAIQKNCLVSSIERRSERSWKSTIYGDLARSFC